MAVSPRKNFPGAYPGVLLAIKSVPAFGTTWGQLTPTSVMNSALFVGLLTTSLTLETAFPPGVNFTVAPSVLLNAYPTFGADETTLQVKEYCPTKRAGQPEVSSSEKVVRPAAGTAWKVWSSKGLGPARSEIAARIGLLPQVETEMVSVAALDALPSASVAVTDTVKLPPATSAMNEGAAELDDFSTAALPGGARSVQL